MKDPIVEEIRRIRDEHSSKFGYNIKEICKDIRKHQEASGKKTVKPERKNRLNSDKK